MTITVTVMVSAMVLVSLATGATSNGDFSGVSSSSDFSDSSGAGPSEPNPKCTVAVEKGKSNKKGVFGGEAQLTLTTTGWGAKAATGHFAYFYVQHDLSIPVLLRVDATSHATFTAPIPQGAGSIQFMVKMFPHGSLRPSTQTATCSFNISQPTDMNAARKKLLDALKNAITAGNPNAVLEAALLAVSTIFSGSPITKDERGKIKADVMAALASIFSNGKGNKQKMTKDERRSAIQVLAQLSRGQEGNVNMTETERQQVRDLVSVIVDTNASNIDTRSQGQEILDVISQLLEKAAIRLSTRLLSLATASNLAVGQFQTMTSAKYNISATKESAAGLKNSVVLSGNVRLVIPAALVDAIPDVQNNTEVAISTVEYAENPTNQTAQPLLTLATEIDFQADGQSTAVSNLAKPITIKLQLTSASAAVCRFFNKTLNQWSSEGVTTGTVDLVKMEITCYSTHLSLFAAQPSGDAGSGDTDGDRSKTTVYIIVGLVCGVAVIAIAVVGLLMMRKKEEKNKNGEGEYLMDS